MPKETSSPFTPGFPVPLDSFVGRTEEIERLRRKVMAAGEGRLQVAFMTGERGIGKSSLASLLRFRAEREAGLIGLHTFLGGATTLEHLVHRVFDRLLKESVGTSWFTGVKDLFGSRIQQIDLFGIGVEFGAQPQDLTRLAQNFAPALRSLADRTKKEKNGILLVLDDINGLAALPEFANWLKSLVDEIATSQKPLPLFLLLVGLDERRQQLITHQASLARVFDLVAIRPWAPEETEAFYRHAFSSVNVAIDEAALAPLVTYAGGLPVLAHEIGDAVFNLDEDNRIDADDSAEGIYAAAEIVGRKHLEPQVFKAIRSVRYRSILRRIAAAGPLEDSFLRSEVIGRLGSEERSVLDNFLKRMTSLGVILREAERGAGAYRFTNSLYRLYFALEAASRAEG